MKRLSLPARMKWVQALVIAAMLVIAFAGGHWLSEVFPWWAAWPLGFAFGWVLAGFTMSKVLPRIFEWVIRRWINEQPEHLRYLLLLRMHFELEDGS